MWRGDLQMTARTEKPASKRERADTQLTGAQGEAIVLYELMWRGWVPANVNQFVRNARNIDIIATSEASIPVALSVKTSGKTANGAIRLTAKQKDLAFNRHKGAQAAFVVFVLIDKTSSKKYRCFVVPTDIAERAVQEAHDHWLRFPKRDGKPRKDSFKAIQFAGTDSDRNIASAFATKWADYEDAWDQLKRQPARIGV